ncbi:unnamed protein product, partial [Heterosigma akashiwo]
AAAGRRADRGPRPRPAGPARAHARGAGRAARAPGGPGGGYSGVLAGLKPDVPFPHGGAHAARPGFPPDRG